jgi:hypothetical protein
VEERVSIDLTRYRVVNDEARLEPFVLRLEPRIEPEALDAHDLLLLVTHRAADVHHVDDDRVRLGEVLELERAKPDVLLDGDDDRLVGVVRAGGDLPLQRFFEGALEVTQRLRAHGVDARVLDARSDDLLTASVLDVRQLQLFTEDRRELVERHVDLEHVLAFAFARFAVPLARLLRALADLIARLAFALAHAALP